MITVTFVGREEVIARLKRMYPAVQARLATSIPKMQMDLVGYIMASKLHGQVLHHKSGKLAGSIRAQPVQVTETAVTGRVGSYNCEYAAVHEYGFHGSVEVRTHQKVIEMVFGRPISPMQITVGAHVREMNMLERSFIRSALADKADFYRERIMQAARDAARGVP